MPQLGSSVIRREPDYDSVDRFFKALALSFLFHLIAITFFYIYSSIVTPPVRKPPEPEAYVVYLADPGPLTSIQRPKPGKRSKRMVRTAKPLRKSLAIPKKLSPVTKKVEVAEKKLTVEQKAVTREIKEVDRPSKEYQKVKKGGAVDIRKFPYEWYLRSMEDKIYRNWDTISTSFFTDHALHVTVHFAVSRQGKVGDIYVEESSLNDALDISAMDAVRQSAPLPPLPAGYSEQFLEVHFGFSIEPNR
ncbi:MAG: TonB family protein [Nitrospinota bacterium]